MDFINTEKNHKMADIILSNSNSNSSYNPRDSLSSTTSSVAMGRIQSSASSVLGSDCDFYYHSTMEGYDNFMADETERRQKLLDATLASLTTPNNDGELYLYNNGFDDEDIEFNCNDDGLSFSSEADDGSEIHFCWDKCLPDQMFVFNQENLPKLLDSVVNHAQDSLSNPQDPSLMNNDMAGMASKAVSEGDQTVAPVWTPANIIFLLARFAHYFCTNEVLDEVLEGSLERINQLVNVM